MPKKPLEKVDLGARLERDEYEERLREEQVRVRELAYGLYQAERSIVVAFEGWDAAGKGGAIRRFTEHLDPRGYEVYPIAAPQGDSAARHYLWRFWRRLKPPAERQILIFDRSWYGRVLVERVEGFATEQEWRRAYDEINDFERQITDAGIAVAKIWVHISLEEQLSRFERRQETPHKRWKLTDEDWRNREKWPLYEEAVNDMLERTDTDYAPWFVISGEDKLSERVDVCRTLRKVMQKHLADVEATPDDAD
jgi:polyphosphate kinase 2 (PPK2 family)